MRLRSITWNTLVGYGYPFGYIYCDYCFDTICISWFDCRMFRYSGNNLVSVKGDGYSLDRNYSDARTLSLNLNGEITSYVLNEYNFLIKSDNGKGEVMNVTYEPGNGNFYHMYRLDREQEGFPVIK